MIPDNVLVTGGTGTLGKAIAKRFSVEYPHCTLTIYSRDPVRQQEMRRQYPQYRYALGDITDKERLTGLAYGHNLIIHAAAQKHIPQAEQNPDQCLVVNVAGSITVLNAAFAAGVGQVLAISTDKACHPVNTYGCSKLAMERVCQHAGIKNRYLKINLCRYGNVIGSTGSVIPVWQQAIERGERPKITDPTMTRFWLTEDQAVDLILYALDEPTGTVTIPKLPALSMAKLAEYVLGEHAAKSLETIGLRPGEKLHEELLTPEESPFAADIPGTNYIRLYPVTGVASNSRWPHGYTSDIAPELTKEQFEAML